MLSRSRHQEEGEDLLCGQGFQGQAQPRHAARYPVVPAVLRETWIR